MAPRLPIARVLPLLGLAHLDRPFDYQVTAAQDEQARPGVRVRVRFSGRLVDGYLLDRIESSDHPGRLGWLERVTSPEQVLTPELATLARAVADRYAGTMTDVLRLAIPPRHARTEQATAAPPGTPVPPTVDLTGWEPYRHADSFLGAVADGKAARAAWQALPGEDWPARLAEVACHTMISGRSTIIVVPDQRDLNRLEAACGDLIGDRVVSLSAGLGPSARYRRWLRALRGQASVVIGTRSAAFTPVPNLGLIVVWDDGDESLCEPRAPYPHTREVAVLRSHSETCALILAGAARTTETQALVAAGWAHDLTAPRAVIRERTPTDQGALRRGQPGGPRSAGPLGPYPGAGLRRRPGRGRRRHPGSVQRAPPRLPTVTGLRTLSFPRALPSLSRTDAGGRSRRGEQFAGWACSSCRWCGHPEADFRCAECGFTKVRASDNGAEPDRRGVGTGVSAGCRS